MVPHRGTNWAALWLTSQIGRDAVLSESYGRGYLIGTNAHIYVVRMFRAGKHQFPVVRQVMQLCLGQANPIHSGKTANLINAGQANTNPQW